MNDQVSDQDEKATDQDADQDSRLVSKGFEALEAIINKDKSEFSDQDTDQVRVRGNDEDTQVNKLIKDLMTVQINLSSKLNTYHLTSSETIAESNLKMLVLRF